MLYRFLLGFLIGCLLAGCISCSKRTAPLSSSIQHIDTSWIKETLIERDSLIPVPGSMSSMILTSFELDTIKNKEVKHKQSYLKLGKDIQGNVHIDCICDTFSILAKLRDREIKEFSKKEVIETVIVPERFIPKWVRFLAIAGAGSIAFFIMRFVLTFK